MNRNSRQPDDHREKRKKITARIVSAFRFPLFLPKGEQGRPLRLYDFMEELTMMPRDISCHI